MFQITQKKQKNKTVFKPKAHRCHGSASCNALRVLLLKPRCRSAASNDSHQYTKQLFLQEKKIPGNRTVVWSRTVQTGMSGTAGNELHILMWVLSFKDFGTSVIRWLFQQIRWYFVICNWKYSSFLVMPSSSPRFRERFRNFCHNSYRAIHAIDFIIFFNSRALNYQKVKLLWIFFVFLCWKLTHFKAQKFIKAVSGNPHSILAHMKKTVPPKSTKRQLGKFISKCKNHKIN